jgi:hypothetical protein
MTRHTIRRLAATILLGMGLSGSGALGFTSVASARPAVDPPVVELHGTCVSSAAVATAVLTRLSAGRYNLSIVAAHLPALNTLHAGVERHVYVAWLVDDAVLRDQARPGAAGLVLRQQAGTYAGQGSIVARGVSSVIVTAEPAAGAAAPIWPMLIVLAGASHQM